MNHQQIQELFSKAIAHRSRNENDQALRLFDSILIDEPSFTPGWNERAALLAKLNCHFDAILCYIMALQNNPEEAGLYTNRGVSFMAMCQFGRAEADFKKAAELNPSLPEIYNNLGILNRRIGHVEESIEHYRKAIVLRDDYADAHLGLAMSLLELQQFEEGWKEFEWRWECGQMPRRQVPYPQWQGERCPDKGLLLLGEQGLGDVIQFCRYAKFAKEKFGGKVYIEVRPVLARLMQGIEGIDEVVSMGMKLPSNIAYQIPLCSLPALVGTEKGFMGPYIDVDQHVSSHWRQLLQKIPSGVRVGLVWAGMNRVEQPVASAIDERRSLLLRQFAPLADVKGVTWVSLQLGEPAQQIKNPPSGMPIVDVTRDFDDLAHTAGCVDNLDLVITVDTAMVHLAAGMGKPTWMLGRFDGCWRWFGDQARSPWYPSLRQYRQPKEGDWESVIDAITRDLQRFVVAKRKQAA